MKNVYEEALKKNVIFLFDLEISIHRLNSCLGMDYFYPCCH
jgi:hypothetical protein